MSARLAWWTPVFGAREGRGVLDVLERGFVNDGPVTATFEWRLSAYLDVPYAVATTSGTAALFLALAALEIGPGDEVIVPDVTFVATANAVRLTGATPVLADVDPVSFCLDPHAVERVLTLRTRAIVPVHVSGRPGPLDAVVALARRRGLAVVEDAAEALGSRLGARALGTIGDVGAFSFTANKLITTGQGGLVVTRDERIYERLRMLKDQGRRERGTGGPDVHPTVGYNFKFTDLQAAVGVAQLDDLERRLAHRRALWEMYQRHLGDVPGVQLVLADLDGGVRPLWIDARVDGRDHLYNWLLAHAIETRPFWRPLHTQQPYRADGAAFPVSTSVSATALWLPSSLSLDEAAVTRVCAEIAAWSAARPEGAPDPEAVAAV